MVPKTAKIKENKWICYKKLLLFALVLLSCRLNSASLNVQRPKPGLSNLPLTDRLEPYAYKLLYKTDLAINRLFNDLVELESLITEAPDNRRLQVIPKEAPPILTPVLQEEVLAAFEPIQSVLEKWQQLTPLEIATDYRSAFMQYGTELQSYMLKGYYKKLEETMLNVQNKLSTLIQLRRKILESQPHGPELIPPLVTQILILFSQSIDLLDELFNSILDLQARISPDNKQLNLQTMPRVIHQYQLGLASQEA